VTGVVIVVSNWKKYRHSPSNNFENINELGKKPRHHQPGWSMSLYDLNGLSTFQVLYHTDRYGAVQATHGDPVSEMTDV
jgi:hypothetical protein